MVNPFTGLGNIVYNFMIFANKIIFTVNNRRWVNASNLSK